jgi:hypothetical protein
MKRTSPRLELTGLVPHELRIAASRPAASASGSPCSGTVVRILDPATGALLREHERQHLGRYTEHPDEPRRTPPPPLQLLARSTRGATKLKLAWPVRRRRSPMSEIGGHGLAAPAVDRVVQ